MQKALRSSILRKEIHSQPKVLARILKRETPRIKRLAETIKKQAPSLILVVGRGTADNAGLYGKYLFGAHNRLAVCLATSHSPAVVRIQTLP